MESDVPVPGAAGRVLIVLASPRVAPGLLSWAAWGRLRGAHQVHVADLDPAWSLALAEAGVVVRDVTGLDARTRAEHLVDAARAGRPDVSAAPGATGATGAEVVWFAGPDDASALSAALTAHLGRLSDRGVELPEVEVLNGSYDLPGARLLDVVTVMDTLRSPGGCPWDAGQTHGTLAPYLLEESHEVLEAIAAGDRDHLREELGDVLLQVVFHARVAQDDPEAPFSVDDVAAGLVDKLVHRHPHVFADGDASTPDEVEQAWERLKAHEKGPRGLFEGVPPTLPALARGQKYLRRLTRAGFDPAVAVPDGALVPTAPGAVADPHAAARPPEEAPDGAPGATQDVARELWAVLRRADALGVDAETALRDALAKLGRADPSGGL